MNGNGGNDVPESAPQKQPKEKKTIELSRLVELANAGKPKAIKLLRRTMRKHPEIWQQAGNLTRLAEQRLIRIIMRSNNFGRDSLELKLNELKTELGGSSPSPIIRLCVDRVVACWLHLHYYDLMAETGKDHVSPQARAVAKRQDQAHRRYLQALKSLNTLRRLEPTPQVVEDEPGARVRVYPAKQSRRA
jgi:hypothetical protein